MITLTNGHIQGPNNIPVPNGTVELILSQDATVIASPFGQVMASIPIIFKFDSVGDILAGSQIWSNAELTPSGTAYLVNFYDANGARVNANPFIWVFAQAAGSNVDIGTIQTTSNSVSYPAQAIISSNGIARPNTRRWSIWDFTPTSPALGFPGGITVFGGASPVLTSGAGGGGGTWPNGPDANDGMFVQLTSSNAGAVGAAGYLTTDSTAANKALHRVGRNLMIQFRFRFPTTGDMTAALHWLALTDQFGGTPALNVNGFLVPGSANIMGFRFSGGQWFGVTQTGGTQTAVALTGGADTVSHTYQAQMNDIAGTVTFFIDGVQVGVSSTNMPAAGTNMGILMSSASTAHTNLNMNVEYFYVERDF